MEEWRPIKGFDDGFEVSSIGRIRSVTRVVHRSGVRGNLTVKGRLMRTPISTHYGGYKSVCFNMYDDNGNKHVKHYLVHRLVAEAFIPNPENKPEVNHKDGDKLNCTVGNLEWVTRQENIRHACATGLNTPNLGEKHGRCLLTENDVLTIRKLLADGICATELAQQYGVSNSAIYDIKHRRNWRWL